ncbi:bifunctional folylpolyglutamate synthase/dihydrofolate synthase [Anaerosinus massiliensis]|uniref:bifunctional folylpolyglutamate synthase/dihydrofolate synthase n=1 Tax=Massilibacillus massiliensis TaxID=1806837 RepID=UPI000B0D8130|nr:folylpolyglutamate synthase/dihydrofolate synthase family protein [Massilibacillus massiliensis]
MNYQESLTYLDGLNKFGINLGLKRITQLLVLMGNPQNKYKTIHVTGTNGKGSTTAMLTAILNNAKIKTGMYISPHLVSYTERMQVNGKNISEEDFAESIAYVSTFVDRILAEGGESPTQFEVITAAAFYYFSKMEVEYAVIEVGLGGLLDSTNVIKPEVSVITNVTFEHADRCGGTLAGIAEHKAGIIKEGVPVITAAKGEALDIIRKVAEQKSADMFIAGEDFESFFKAFDGHKQEITFSADLMGVAMVYVLNLLGQHQVENSAVAIMTALVLANSEKRITSEAIHNALLTVSWPGRFEVLSQEDHLILVDGAHNIAGAQSLRINLDTYFSDKEIVFLLGVLKDKDIDGILKALVKADDSVVVTEPLSERAAEPAYIANKIIAKQVEVASSIEDGLRKASELAAGPDKILCIAGSLYLIGAVRSLLVKA